MNRPWPLIQRQLEFETLKSALTSDTGACGVVLTGDAGVGKTTLARVATQSLPGDVRWVAGTESARSIPLGVFAHLVGSSTSRDPVAFLSAAREALLGAGGPVVIGVDDAHLLDQLSATFLHQLAIDRAAHIVATVRSGESTPDAVTSLWKDGHLMRLELSPFTRDQSVTLIESVLGGPLEGLSAKLMWEASGGNALFLHHLVEGALEAGTLRERRGVWQLRGRAAITPELASLLEDRIEHLPADVMRVLELLTFCEPLALDTLSDLAGEEAVEDAEQRGLIQIVEDGPKAEVRYNHPMFSEVVRRRVGRAAARRLRGNLVEALRTHPITGPGDRIRLAELALDSDQTPDVDLLVTAAKDAIAFANVPLGERLAKAAVDRDGGFRAANLLARSQLWQGHAADAEAALNRFDPDTLDESQLVRWGVTRIANLFWSAGDAETAEAVLEEVRQRVQNPAAVAVVRGIGATCAVAENRLSEGLAEAEAVLAEPNPTPWSEEMGTFAASMALAVVGRGSEVAALTARADAAMTKVDGLTRYPAAIGPILALTLTGQFDAAARRAQTYLDHAATTGQYLGWGQANILYAIVDVARGRFAETVRRLEQAMAALTVGDTGSAIGWVFPAYPILAQAYSVLGRTADAKSVVAAAEGRYGRHVAVFGPMFEIGKAWEAAGQGETSRAIATACGAADAARESGQFAIEALALHLATRLGDASTAPRLAELAERCDGPMVRLAAAQAAAFADGDGSELARIAREFEEIGALLDAADASAQSAVAYSTADRRREALDAAATANALAERCDHASTPAVLEAARPLPLTSREREVASMVAVGLSNREIADRLVVSVRTVEGHIYRACTKLDVADRGELAESLRDRH
ncbi:helix-turn-helix transcriptional regulator [Rhodococcus spelaei]|uniref:Helix-turn-helix transcriptional regulator n=1 Tax=Rhodococcus spelaei TaxID=2546320 RepID=A0A541BAI7_9NOCA|nr:LuxR family transcriptional regulator [Rhodococcus spelaei]TQF69337.1 helix-turn-helix transcriptional regulator [Rhodococcus spelaei]